MSQAPTRTQAKRNTRIAQVTVLTLAGVSVAAIVFGVPGVEAPKVEMQTVSDILAERRAEKDRLDQAEVVDDNAPTHDVDLLAIAQRLEIIHHVAEPEGDGAQDPDTPEVINTDGSEKVEIKYLGSIAERTRSLALLSVNGRQRIIPVGATSTITPDGGDPVTLKVIGLSSSEVVVERDGMRERVAKAPRLAGAVTRVASENPQGQASGPGATPAGRTPGSPEGESDLDRRRRESLERRQRILEQRNRDRNQPSGPDREN